MLNKQAIIDNFNHAASSYDGYAHPQKKSALELSRLIAPHIKDNHRLLEIGCGTGFLTQNLLEINPTIEIVASDISPDMIAQCQQKMPHLKTALIDGEHPPMSEKYDVVCSNLTLQWFSDLSASCQKFHHILGDNGLLAFSTLLEDNFSQWQEACDHSGIPHYQEGFLSLNNLEMLLNQNFQATITTEKIDISFDTMSGFLKHIRYIGAKATEHITPIAKLKKATRYLSETFGNTISYHIAYVIAKKK